LDNSADQAASGRPPEARTGAQPLDVASAIPNWLLKSIRRRYMAPIQITTPAYRPARHRKRDYGIRQRGTNRVVKPDMTWRQQRFRPYLRKAFPFRRRKSGSSEDAHRNRSTRLPRRRPKKPHAVRNEAHRRPQNGRSRLPHSKVPIVRGPDRQQQWNRGTRNAACRASTRRTSSHISIALTNSIACVMAETCSFRSIIALNDALFELRMPPPPQARRRNGTMGNIPDLLATKLRFCGRASRRQQERRLDLAAMLGRAWRSLTGDGRGMWRCRAVAIGLQENGGRSMGVDLKRFPWRPCSCIWRLSGRAFTDAARSSLRRCALLRRLAWCGWSPISRSFLCRASKRDRRALLDPGTLAISVPKFLRRSAPRIGTMVTAYVDHARLVAGLGRMFTEHGSWRWCSSNLPLGMVSVARYCGRCTESRAGVPGQQL